MVHQMANFVGLKQALGVQRVLIRDCIGDSMVGVDLQRRIERGDVLVERQRLTHIANRVDR